MGCSGCSTTTSGGTPKGCKTNGGCTSGGCTKMGVFDWLSNLPMDDAANACKIIEVTFNQGSRKDFYRNNTLHPFYKGELITVEGVSGFDVGKVSLTGELVRLQLKKRNLSEKSEEIRKVLRKTSEQDIQKFNDNKKREPEALMMAKSMAVNLGLRMKLIEVEIQADGRKGTFFYTAEERVDFRELIKMFAGEFKLKVEMKQIGIRQGAAKVGSIGSCGRELCCSTWLTDFKSVTTTAARYQNLSINQSKLSGQCGRLKCCLNYELDTYLDALQHFPDNAERIKVVKGDAYLVKKDIFKNLMWYTLPSSTKHYPLTIERVKEVISLNKKGVIPEDLGAVDLAAGKKEGEQQAEFVELVGHITLKSLEKNTKKKKFHPKKKGPHNKPKGGKP